MNCNDAIDRILRLDNGEPCDRETGEHIASCDRCCEEMRRLTVSIAAVRASHAVNRGETLTDRINLALHRIAGAVPGGEATAGAIAEQADYAKWMYGGAVIVFAMVLLPNTAVYSYLSELPGSRIEATIAISFGLILSAYIGLCIAANLNRLTALIRRFT